MTKATAALTALLAALVLISTSAAQLGETFTNWIEHPAIAYRTRPPADPVARLNRSLKEGRTTLTFDGRSGFLRSTLEALQIPIESQVAVFTADSLQGQRISTVNPRAIFFNDAVSVGWVRGGFIEVASQDPVQGIVFYVLDNEVRDKPQFTRREDCLSCHYSRATVGVPGMIDQGFGQITVDHRTPIANRWGGWYVTGEPSSLRHLGNHVARTAETTEATTTWPSFDGRFDTAGYLSTHSDIVSLLVFNHQTRGMNLVARVGWEARVADFNATRTEGPALRAPSALADAPVAIDEAARELVDYFLFVDEAPLTMKIRGTAGFAERFTAEGPRDHQGRSLRDFDLNTRLFRYSCSYLIYSEAFDALPPRAKDAIYRRLWQVLSGEEKNQRYRRASLDDRRAIVEILRDTKGDLPAYFQSL